MWRKVDYTFKWSLWHYQSLYISESQWFVSSQQHFYWDIIRREQVWQMDYNHNWERGESIWLQCTCFVLGINSRWGKIFLLHAMPVELQCVFPRSCPYRHQKNIVFYYSKADGTKWDMGASSSDLSVTNLTLPLHWSNINISPLAEYAWLLQTGQSASFPTNHLDMQLPPALELFLSCGYCSPFIWVWELKWFPG